MTKNLNLILSFLLVAASASGQKLPNVQEKPLGAPAGVKIDGKANEWNNLMQAKNSATEITYAISNDDENLYLVYQASATQVSSNIMTAGFNLQIYKNGKKDRKNMISITYPALEKGQRINVNWQTRMLRESPPSDELIAQRTDSLVQVNNNKISTQGKWIAVHGIAGIDSLISIYNDEGIKAAGLFDNKKILTCEIAVSLKKLDLSANQASKFDYHIVINGGPNKYNGPVIYGATLADGTPMPEAQLEAGRTRIAALFATTDFWGEYTLATKP